jgi:hypothetical protein
MKNSLYCPIIVFFHLPTTSPLCKGYDFMGHYKPKGGPGIVCSQERYLALPIWKQGLSTVDDAMNETEIQRQNVSANFWDWKRKHIQSVTRATGQQRYFAFSNGLHHSYSYIKFFQNRSIYDVLHCSMTTIEFYSKIAINSQGLIPSPGNL